MQLDIYTDNKRRMFIAADGNLDYATSLVFIVRDVHGPRLIDMNFAIFRAEKSILLY